MKRKIQLAKAIALLLSAVCSALSVSAQNQTTGTSVAVDVMSAETEHSTIGRFALDKVRNITFSNNGEQISVYSNTDATLLDRYSTNDTKHIAFSKLYAVTLADTADNSDLKDEQTWSLTLAHNLAEGWNSLVVPAAVSSDQLSSLGLTAIAFTGTSSDGGDISANFNSVSALEANTPYLVRTTTAASNITIDQALIEANSKNTLTKEDNSGNYNFVGSLKHFAKEDNANPIAVGDYVVQGGKLEQSESGNNELKAFEAYLKAMSDAAKEKPLRITVDGSIITGIEAVQIASALMGDGYTYDLLGRRVVDTENYRGIAIKNGKKILCK